MVRPGEAHEDRVERHLGDQCGHPAHVAGEGRELGRPALLGRDLASLVLGRKEDGGHQTDRLDIPAQLPSVAPILVLHPLGRLVVILLRQRHFSHRSSGSITCWSQSMILYSMLRPPSFTRRTARTTCDTSRSARRHRTASVAPSGSCSPRWGGRARIVPSGP